MKHPFQAKCRLKEEQQSVFSLRWLLFRYFMNCGERSIHAVSSPARTFASNNNERTKKIYYRQLLFVPVPKQIDISTQEPDLP